MKKQILIACSVVFTAGMLFIAGCKKDDTTPPTITLTGSSVTMSLQGTYTEPGFTAEDDEDGDITSSVTSDMSSTNPNKNLTGPYTITYTVSDAAGNTGTATRVVTVVNDAESAYAGTYSSASETDILGPYTYVQPFIVTASTTQNNRVTMNRLGDFANNAVYMDIVGTNITVPSQTHTNVGTGPNPCDVHDRQTDGTGTKTANGFNLTYNDAKVAPCTGSRTGVQAVFVK